LEPAVDFGRLAQGLGRLGAEPVVIVGEGRAGQGQQAAVGSVDPAPVGAGGEAAQLAFEAVLLGHRGRLGRTAQRQREEEPDHAPS
jgi:hypothetical protein